MRRRTVLTGLLAWTLVVVAVSAVTWAVIDAAGQDLLAGDSLVTDAAPAVTLPTSATVPSPSRSPREDRSRPPRAHPTEEATQKPLARVTSSSSAAPRSEAARSSAPTGRTRTWAGPPGTVSVRCDADGIALLSASPNNGYRIEVARGSQEIEVHFNSSTREYQLKARCTDGTPTFRTESEGAEEGDD